MCLRDDMPGSKVSICLALLVLGPAILLGCGGSQILSHRPADKPKSFLVRPRPSNLFPPTHSPRIMRPGVEETSQRRASLKRALSPDAMPLAFPVFRDYTLTETLGAA